VFSFYKNDDITRRGLHVQLVSRISRTIGKALNLNLDLIEAIALGHDIGHTPFGHAGESYLDALLFEHIGRHFSHNIHSVRVLDKIYPYNITLQTLNGIASHDGEMELPIYEPKATESFEEFDAQIEECYLDKTNVKKFIPSTLEGCVVRISDIIAYLGKDRQDAERADIRFANDYEDSHIGRHNAEMINNLMVNIIENSYGKNRIEMDEAHFSALKQANRDNYDLIYKSKGVAEKLDQIVLPMMTQIYEKLLNDILTDNKSSPIFRHHIDYVNKAFYSRSVPYEQTEANRIVVDYIASMTDDYFIDLHAHFFPKSDLKVEYKGYFNEKR
jgi:dGTPase